MIYLKNVDSDIKSLAILPGAANHRNTYDGVLYEQNRRLYNNDITRKDKEFRCAIFGLMETFTVQKQFQYNVAHFKAYINDSYQYGQILIWIDE